MRPDPGGFERLVRRRGRRQRNRRITAGVVALIVAAAGMWGVIRVVETSVDRRLPASPIIDERTVDRLEPAWRAPTDAIAGSTPVIAGGQVLVGSTDGHLNAFDAFTGVLLWRGRTNGELRSGPAVAEGEAYAHATDGMLYAFALDCASNGAECDPDWVGRTGGSTGSPPTAAEGMIYVDDGGGRTFAFRSHCGTGGARCEPEWVGQVPTVSGNQIAVAPVVAGGRVWDTSAGSPAFFEVGCASGGAACEPLLHDFGVASTSPVAGGGMVFVGAPGYVYGFPESCLPAECGAEWRALAGEDPPAPGIGEGLVFVAGAPEGGLAAVPISCDLMGRPCAPSWTGTLGGEAVSSPVVAGGLVFVPVAPDRLLAFPADCRSDGGPCGALAAIPIGAAEGSLSVWAHRVVYVAGDGALTAYTVDAARI